MSNYLTVATSVQRRVLSLLISEIQTGFWAKARPAEHVPFWDDVEVLVGTELGFSEKAALRNYNFVNLDFFSQNEEKLLDLAREVLPEISVKQLKKELIQLNQIIGGRLKSEAVPATKLRRGRTATETAVAGTEPTVRRQIAQIEQLEAAE